MRKLGWIVALVLVAPVACSKDKPPAADKEPASVVEKAAGSDQPKAEKEHHRKHEDRRDPTIDNPPPLKLEVKVGDKSASWQQVDFDKVAKYTKGSDGDARDVWSLRELAHQLVGPNARVTAIAGEEGSHAVIAPAEWNDATKTPLLHTTRRGTLKFRWADADGKWAETAVKDVTKIEVAP
jgi:hypothetical protein